MIFIGGLKTIYQDAKVMAGRLNGGTIVEHSNPNNDPASDIEQLVCNAYYSVLFGW